MTTDTPHPCIVAGYDGSAASRAALSLAVSRARPHGRVVVVHAFDPPDGRYDGVSYQRQLNAGLDRARTLLANLPEEVPGLASLDWGTEVLVGPAAPSGSARSGITVTGHRARWISPCATLPSSARARPCPRDPTRISEACSRSATLAIA